MPKVTITIEENYAKELRTRLDEYGISLGALAREMAMDRSQLARLFNTDVVPRLDTVIKLERAVRAISRRNKKKAQRSSLAM